MLREHVWLEILEIESDGDPRQLRRQERHLRAIAPKSEEAENLPPFRGDVYLGASPGRDAPENINATSNSAAEPTRPRFLLIGWPIAHVQKSRSSAN